MKRSQIVNKLAQNLEDVSYHSWSSADVASYIIEKVEEYGMLPPVTRKKEIWEEENEPGSVTFYEEVNEWDDETP